MNRNLQNNDKDADASIVECGGGVGQPKESEKKAGFFQRVWNFIKKILGIG